jgi:hypothetical protein
MKDLFSTMVISRSFADADLPRLSPDMGLDPCGHLSGTIHF